MPPTDLLDELTTFAFPRATLDFLRALRDNNDREWFAAHRAEYERDYVQPAKAFVAAVAQPLARVAPGIQAEPRILGSIFRINRDTRFSKDKRPYKDHLDFWFWEGERKAAASGLFMRLSPERLVIGAGGHSFRNDVLAAYRRAVDDPASGAQLAAITDELERDGFEIEGARYARVPPGMDPEGAAARFARNNALFVHVDEPAELAGDGARLVPTCLTVWKRLAPLHRWIVEHVQ